MQGRAEVEPRAALVPLRRAYDLSPFDTWVVEGLVDALLKAGELDAARSVASAVAAGRLPVHQIASELLSLRIEASRAHFQAALALARTAFDIRSEERRVREEGRSRWAP